MSSISKDKIGKGAAFLYIETIAGMFSAYIFWLLISRITSPEIIGISGAIVSFAAIVTTVQNMGVPISIQRFMGRALGTGETESIRSYFMSSIILLAVSITICSSIILLARFYVFQALHIINYDFIVVIVILIAASSTSRLLRGIIIASINTKVLAKAALYSGMAKFTIAIALLYIGMGAIGVLLGILSFTIMECIFMGVGIKKTLGSKLEEARGGSIKESVLNLLRGGMPNYIPNLITAVGSQLGTILVFGSHGASQAGFYFLAFSIYTALVAGMGVLFSITYPVLSSMEKGAERVSRRTIKMSFLFTIPFSYSLIFFSDNIMIMFGNMYLSASLSLQILLLSVMPVALMSGVTNYVYASGNYRYTMWIGVASSAPRTLLYFLLVSALGSVGAAISFTIGSFVGLAVSVIVARRVNASIDWRGIFVISITPIGISYVLSLLEINYLLSILITLCLSYAIYIKLHIMMRPDIHDASKILPGRVAKPAVKLIDYLGSKIDSSY